MKLMGVWEIAQRLGVGRQRAGILAKQKGFPDPVDTLRMGKVWLAEDVEAWIAENRPALAEEPETD
jgi:prophage regulatory protein